MLLLLGAGRGLFGVRAASTGVGRVLSCTDNTHFVGEPVPTSRVTDLTPQTAATRPCYLAWPGAAASGCRGSGGERLSQPMSNASVYLPTDTK